MEYRRLGHSGLKVSAISLGAWLTYGSDVVEFDNAVSCIRRAIEQGVNYIDVADVYSSGKAEKLVGKALKDYRRGDLVIATKAYWPMSDNINDRGLSRKHLFESVHRSLKRLGTDYMDIFFCHRHDDETPIEETVRALDDLITQGKILYWGTSMWNAANLTEGVQVAKSINAHRPIAEQPVYNMLERDFVEGNIQKAALDNDIGLVVWSPLAQGVLTGKYNDGVPENSRYTNIDWFHTYVTEDRLTRARALSVLAAEVGVTPGALAIAWVLNNPAVDSAITGATRPEHVDQNLKALEIDITPELNERIETILQNKPVVPSYN